MTFAEADARYPHDPRFAGRADVLQGLEKLRAFDSPGMRLAVYELHENVTRFRLPQHPPVAAEPDDSDTRFP